MEIGDIYTYRYTRHANANKQSHRILHTMFSLKKVIRKIDINLSLKPLWECLYMCDCTLFCEKMRRKKISKFCIWKKMNKKRSFLRYSTICEVLYNIEKKSVRSSKNVENVSPSSTSWVSNDSMFEPLKYFFFSTKFAFFFLFSRIFRLILTIKQTTNFFPSFHQILYSLHNIMNWASSSVYKIFPSFLLMFFLLLLLFFLANCLYLKW